MLVICSEQSVDVQKSIVISFEHVFVAALECPLIYRFHLVREMVVIIRHIQKHFVRLRLSADWCSAVEEAKVNIITKRNDVICPGIANGLDTSTVVISLNTASRSGMLFMLL